MSRHLQPLDFWGCPSEKVPNRKEQRVERSQVPHPWFLRVGSYDLTPQKLPSSPPNSALSAPLRYPRSFFFSPLATRHPPLVNYPHMASPYKISIPMYEGPLDLLLDLIKKQEMNIHDIQISKITSQYLDYLHQLEVQNIDVSAEFIYMAATLIYIKSKMLLPPDPLASPEEQAGDPREELVQRLIEHEKFKNAAQLLYQKQQIEENVWSRPDKTLYNDEGTEGELVVSLVDLVRVFQQVLERKKEVVRIELTHDVFTVAQMIAQLRSQILGSDTNTVSLIQFFEACPSRHAMIVAFLAVLEMVKLQAVGLVQEKQFADIFVKKAKAFDVAFDENGAILHIDQEYQ